MTVKAATVRSRAADEGMTRFEHLFGRTPQPDELKKFLDARSNLLLGIPASARRRAARRIARSMARTS